MRSFILRHIEPVFAFYFFFAFPGTFAIEDMIRSLPYEEIFRLGRFVQLSSWAVFFLLAIEQSEEYRRFMMYGVNARTAQQR